MSKSPTVSVVMPVYNSEKYLEEAIDSILNQTFKNFEFIIINDGSTDKSENIIRTYKDKRIKYFKNRKNMGVTISLNKGVRFSRGELILRMDSDDWAYPDRIGKQVKFMKKHPEVVECGGAIEVCDSNLKNPVLRKYPLTDSQIRRKIFRYNPFAHPATIWRKIAMKKAGYYDKDIPLTQDYDLTFRVGSFGHFANLPDTILKLRTHPESCSIGKGFDQQKITFLIRYRAITKYGYKISLIDIVFNIAQFFGMILLPSGVKFKLFNIIRRYL